MSAVLHPGSVRPIPRAKPRAVPKRKGVSVTGVIVFVCCVSALAFLFSSAFSLGGFMLLEDARAQAIQADRRAALAEISIAELRAEIERLRSAHSVQRWAAVHDLIPSYRAEHEAPTF